MTSTLTIPDSSPSVPLRRCAIHQPNYLPWLGYFYKIARSDIFVFLDSVQFSKNSYINRTQIKTVNGPQWLTVPVSTKGRFGQLISETPFDSAVAWKKKHLGALQTNYGRAPFFREHFPKIESFMTECAAETLSQWNSGWVRLIADILGLKTRFIFSSELPSTPGDPTARLVQICSAVGATAYLRGRGGSTEYQDDQQFLSAGVVPEVSAFVHPTYPQVWSQVGFLPGLCVLDALFSMGATELAAWLKSPQILQRTN